LNQVPFIPGQANVNRFDTMDPQRKLWDWANLTNKARAEAALGVTFTYDPKDLDPPVWNRLPTPVSAGPDKVFQLATPLAGGDMYGYRVKRIGNQGD
jgi:hypothetical protein